MCPFAGDIAFRLMKSAHAAAASTFGVPLPSITICDINAEMLKVREAVCPHAWPSLFPPASPCPVHLTTTLLPLNSTVRQEACAGALPRVA